MAYVNVKANPIKLIEGWLQHKNSQDTKWTTYWCVLKDYVIYIFKNQDTSRDNHIGVLSIGSDTQVKIGDSDPKKGYRFDLYTSKKLNKFKTTKFIERELWKAYLVGLTEGDISDNFDLTSDQIQKVRNDIQRVMSGSNRPPLPVSPRNAHDNNSVGTGFSSPDNSISSLFNQSTQLDGGGPTIRHRFWSNPEKTDQPSWFFTSITRDTAESILTAGRDFGNSLMRESVTFRDTGSYVITKKMEHHCRGPPFNHFEVIRVAEGFKINVENAHKTMTCLSEVMDYFVRMSGSTVTRPMVTNDFKVLGLDIPDYHTKIWKNQTNAESGEDDPDYPQEPEAPVPPYNSSNASKTWSQGKNIPRAALDPGNVNNYGATVNPGFAKRRPRVDEDHMRHGGSASRETNQFNKFSFYPPKDHPQVGREPSNETAILEGLGEAPPPPCSGMGRRTSEGVIEAPTEIHPRWLSRAKSVPILQLPPNLDQEVPVSEPPKLVKPSSNPPRMLPQPPNPPRMLPQPSNSPRVLPETPTEEEPMTPFAREILQRRQLLTKEQNKKQVTFEDTKSIKSATRAEQVDESGALDRDALKKKLNLMFGGGGGLVKPSVGPTSPRAQIEQSASQPTNAEEEYDEVIYDNLD